MKMRTIKRKVNFLRYFRFHFHFHFSFQELKLLPGGPQPNLTFTVKRVVKTRFEGEREEFLCTFVGYKDTLRRWVKKSDLLKE